jgi:hypothetical protein
MGDNLSAQGGQSIAFFFCQRSAQVGFVLDGYLGKFFQCSFAFCSKNQFGVAAVFRAAFSLDQSFRRQLINQDDHATREDTKPFCQRLLIAFWHRGNHPQDPRVRWRNSQHSNAFPKEVGAVRAQLSEQKRCAARP